MARWQGKLSERADPVAVTGAAIMNAIVGANRDESGTVLVDPAKARQALIAAMAMLLEASPSVSTPGDIRRAAQRVATDLRVHIRTLRAHQEATASRAWDATPIAVN
jgi:hypothetical protein